MRLLRMIESSYSAACNARAVLAGFGAPTRSRRVRQRQHAAERHQHRAEPDQEHQRLVIDAHRDAAVGRGFAERNIELAWRRASAALPRWSTILARWKLRFDGVITESGWPSRLTENCAIISRKFSVPAAA